MTARALTAAVPIEDASRAAALTVIAAGKAADAMAAASLRHFGDAPLAGLIVAGVAGRPPTARFERVAGGHPVPSVASEDAGRRALTLARALSSHDRLLVLLSGGASSLMAVPADGVTLDDKRRTTGTLLKAGADIHALNTVRKHLSAIKGGWLAATTRATCDTLVISDVVDDDLSVIASGPTVADASRFEDAAETLRRYGGEEQFPTAVVKRLALGAAGRAVETPKPGDSRLARTSATIIGSRRDAMAGAVAEAVRRGYSVVRIDDPVVGEARVAAAAHLDAVLARAEGLSRPLCVVASGETTVRVTGRGKGGRNQEFVLAAISGARLSHRPPGASPSGSPRLAVASAGTDGVDGPTDAAGAYADSTTVARSLAAGLPPDRHLLDNNSYALFDALGDLIRTGPTGTNVGDLHLILLA